ncbi:unnamed protein product [Cuscuta campestris]|uniref:Uncharacterized protein n=1 Tax=Cuscuta campestris TaxID=132261 RepID=A0A484N8P8_9ASTE|nr:unnamed protein product [Cuscuta campestris]
MQFLVAADPTAQSYWLSWRALLCEASVLFSIVLSLFLIWRYECIARDKSGSDEGEKRKDKSWSIWFDESWRPSVKELHPVVLAVFRLVAFILLAAALTADAIVHGGDLFLYYTQWTFMLVTIYFLFGSLLSIYGCYQYYKTTKVDCTSMDEEKSLHLALSHTQYLQGVNTGDNRVFRRVLSVPKSVGLFGYLFQILFQMTAGSVMLTDCLYWTVIFPFLSIKDYDLSFVSLCDFFVVFLYSFRS